MKVVKNPGGLSEHLQKAIADLETKRLSVGWFDTAKYEDGTPVAYVATIQEFGYPGGNIPPRPFMRPTIAEKRDEWTDTLRKGSKQVINGKLTVTQMLGQFGMMASGEIAQTISQVTSPPLKPSTLRARQSRKKTPGVSTKPLVDTGLLIQSVSSKVEDV